MAHELEPVVEELKRQGFVLARTANGHYSAKSKTGQGGIVHFSFSGDVYAHKNTIRDLKRIGFVWPPAGHGENGSSGPSSKDEPCCTLCYTTGGGCKDIRCACHLPASAFQPASKNEPVRNVPKTSEQLFADLSDARVILQAADEALAAERKRLKETEEAVTRAEAARKDALDTFTACKKKFDDDMLAGLDLGTKGAQE